MLYNHSVIRIFDLISYSHKNLPTAISINKFKGNMNSEKYQCIFINFSLDFLYLVLIYFIFSNIKLVFYVYSAIITV